MNIYNVGRTILHNEKVNYSSLFLKKMRSLSKKHKKGSDKNLNTTDRFLRKFTRDLSVVVSRKSIFFNTYSYLCSLVKMHFFGKISF